MIRFVVFAAAFVAVIYSVLCLVLYLQQDNLLFYRVINDAALLKEWQPKKIEIPAADINIEGWWAENPSSDNDLIILYFGGNAEDVLYTASTTVKKFNARRMLVTNYRGYGATAGEPNQKNLFGDSLLIYEHLLKQPGVRAEHIVVMGRSLGSGVATFLAVTKPVHGAILVTPYDSIAAVAQRHYPFLPVRWLLKNKFPADEFARLAKVPAIMIAAERDTIIPPIHAQHLFNTWLGPKELHVIPNAGHNDIEQDTQYHIVINAFLASI